MAEESKKYYVTYTVDFTRTRAVSAKSEEEARIKATRQEESSQETLRRSGYIIGDIDIVDTSLDKGVSSRWT